MTDQVSIAGGTLVLVRLIGGVTTGPIGAAAGTPIPEIETLGDITEQNAEVTATPLGSKTVRYISGLEDGQPLEMTMFLIPDSPVQKAIQDARKLRKELEITVQPDDTSEQYRFNYRPTTHTIRTGTGGDPKRRVVGGRLNSSVIAEANKNPAYVAANGA